MLCRCHACRISLSLSLSPPLVMTSYVVIMNVIVIVVVVVVVVVLFCFVMLCSVMFILIPTAVTGSHEGPSHRGEPVSPGRASGMVCRPERTYGEMSHQGRSSSAMVVLFLWLNP